LFYTITQGAQFLSLVYLPAVTGSLVLSFTQMIVALLGIGLLKERPTSAQWIGSGLFLIGVLVYFSPTNISSGQGLGLGIAVAGLLANALSAILGRSINREIDLQPATVTVLTMGIGGLILLGAGLVVQGMPDLSLANWAAVLWLALVNSAFAFTLWNRTLRTLSAVESSIINNTMLFQIALLAWIFLSEQPATPEIAGMLLAAAGAAIVQIKRTIK